MPRYRMKLTLIPSLLLTLWSFSIHAAEEASQEAAAQVADPAQPKGVYITVEETIGATAPLRQTRRLDISRAVTPAAPSVIQPAAVEPDVRPDIPALVQAPVPKQIPENTAESRPSAAVAGVAVDGLLPKVSQSAADAAGRIIEMLQRGMLSPELAADLLAKLATAAAEPATLPARFVPAQPSLFVPSAEAAPALQPVVTPQAVAPQLEPMAVDVLAPSEPPVAGVQAPLEVGAVSTPFEPVQVAMADTSRLVLAQATVTPVSSEPPPPNAEPRGWSLARDDRTVRSSLERWTRDANWQLAWEYPVDFQIEFDAKFDGDFVDAVSKVIDGIAGPDRPVRAEFYFGNRVLRIVSGRGE